VPRTHEKKINPRSRFKIETTIIREHHATLIRLRIRMSYVLVIIWELYRGNITKVHPQLYLIYDRELTLTILFSQFTTCKYR
jgi:hypothetical protein